MNWTGFLQKLRMDRFEDIYTRWKGKKIRQQAAASILNVTERTFRRYVRRYEREGLLGLVDKRLGRPSHRRASEEETRAVEALYTDNYPERNVTHFYEAYTELHGGRRSYSWVKNCLHAAKLVKPLVRGGPHRMRRQRRPRVGEMLHQDASTHAWVAGRMWALVITMDDATSEIYSVSSSPKRAQRAT